MASFGRFCPRKEGFIVVNDMTGESLKARCGRNICGYCGPWKAKQIADAVGVSRPTRAILITRPGANSQQIGARIHRVVSEIRGKGHHFEYAFVIEHDRAGQPHVHMAQHGDAFPDELFRSLFRRQGTGRVSWQHVRSPEGFGLYLMKRPLEGLVMSVAEAEALMREFLDMTGQRMIHGSPGFWRDEHGQAQGGLRTALAQLQRKRTPPGSRWRFERRLPEPDVVLPDLTTYRITIPRVGRVREADD